MTINERITELSKQLNISIRSLAKSLDMKENTLTAKIRGERKIDYETISLILEVYPQVSAEWLLRGEGPIFKGVQKENDFIDIFLKGICNSDSQELDAAQEAIASVKRLRNLSSTRN